MTQTSTSNSITTENKPVKLHQSITLTRAKKLGSELNEFVKANNLSANIAGKNFIMVEGWQFVGVQMNLTDIVVSCEEIAPFGETPTEIKYKAVVEIVNQQGVVVSRGFAWCSNKESKKKSFDEYAIASMAQTRAIGKAYRNILSWIVKMAGYEATPIEEIDREQLETDLTKKKQEVLKALNDYGLIAGNDIMNHIQKILGRRVIETTDDTNKILDSLNAES